ncbi:hypothetical protein [Streptomyces sp. NPDC059894]|uniref:hypothetical protein n=1 Tax=unclassified Streptomyces TaxID=2593676 RepID=UPI0036635DCD
MSGGRSAGGHRHAPHLRDPVPGPQVTNEDDTDVQALLATALRGGDGPGEGERRALAAFREARDAGAHRAARTRRRDDWR